MATYRITYERRKAAIGVLEAHGLDPHEIMEEGWNQDGYWHYDGTDWSYEILRTWMEWPDDTVYDELVAALS